MGASLTPVGGPAATPAKVDEVVIPMTHRLLQEALEQARDKGQAAARAQATREMRQALDAQDRVHQTAVAELKSGHADQIKALRIEWEDQAIHRVRAARLWSGLVAFALGATVFTTIMLYVDRQRLDIGINAGMDAMGRSRILNEQLDRSDPRSEEPPCDDENGCRTGQRLPNGRIFRTPEPADAP